MAVQVFEASTSDPDTALDTLNAVFTPERPMRFHGVHQQVDLSLRVRQCGDLAASRMRFTGGSSVATAPFEVFSVTTMLSGRASFASGGEQVRTRQGESVRYPTTRGLDSTWADIDCLVTQVSLAAVERVAVDRLGARPGRLRFTGMDPLSPQAARQWRSLVTYVHHALDDELVTASPLMLGQLAELVAATALVVFPNTTLGAAHVRGPGDAAPAALRRAVAHLEAHAAEPVTLGDVAAAAGTTGRAVQAGFRRHYGTTPMGYLRRVRLHAAHRDLLAADPTRGATVAAVAARWGFGPSSRFSGLYRAEFGVTPRETLRA